MASTKFLGMLGRPNNNIEPASSPLDELDERDVVWSSASTTTDPVPEDSSPAAVADFEPDPKTFNASVHAASPISTFSVSSSSSSTSASPCYFHNTAAGLSTALTAADGDDDSSGRWSSPLIQRKKTALNPSLSPAGAAAISTVVPPPPPALSSSSAAAAGFSALSRSAPVKVPVWNAGYGIRRGRHFTDPTVTMGRFNEEEDNDDEELDDGGEIVPPHEIVARSNRTTRFSVFEGIGRTLKGRDLTTVRNAVMQKTGFLE